jgi:hypothetical protein
MTIEMGDEIPTNAQKLVGALMLYPELWEKLKTKDPEVIGPALSDYNIEDPNNEIRDALVNLDWVSLKALADAFGLIAPANT